MTAVIDEVNASPTADRELRISRVFDAPPELVFEVWTKPEHVGQWWGPRAFTNTIQEMNVRPGGIFRLIMHGPDGHDFPNEIRFVEVVKPERLVYTHSGENDLSFHVTVTFERQGEKTKLTMVTLFPTAEMLDFVAREYGAIEGAREHLDRLGEYLQQVFVTRTFDAPRELVFRAWTDAAQLEQWYAPAGCSIRFTEFDLREGGEFHSCIRTPDGHDCWCKGVYREIVAPERIVYTLAVSDEQGNLITPVQAGMDPEWPRETTVTVTFAEHDGRTTLTLHQTVSASLAQRTGALPSWLSMFDRLETLLQERN